RISLTYLGESEEDTGKTGYHQLVRKSYMFGPVPLLDHAAGEYPRRYFFERNDFMASEYSAVFVQQVAANQNVLFSDTPVRGGNCVVHREGAGIVTLRGQTNQCRALYKVSFGANIGLPA